MTFFDKYLDFRLSTEVPVSDKPPEHHQFKTAKMESQTAEEMFNNSNSSAHPPPPKKLSLNIHVLENGAVLYACKYCDFQSKDKMKLLSHEQKQHSVSLNKILETKTNIKIETSGLNLKPVLEGIKTEQESLKQEFKWQIEGKYSCEHCEYKAERQESVRTHKRAMHEGKKYLCNQCDYKTGWPGDLKLHQKTKHEGIAIVCDQCDYITTRQSNLTVHKKAKHDNVRYPCRHCDYYASYRSHLRIHIKSHEGVTYACDQCDHKSTQKSGLNKHKEAKHLNIRKHLCEFCDYKASSSQSLNYHRKSKHTEK